MPDSTSNSQEDSTKKTNTCPAEKPGTEDGTLDASTGFARRLSLKAQSLVGQTLGQYKIMEEISVGGMGAVFKARQTEPIKRTVALKVIKFESVSPEWGKRFEAERQAMAMMDHPNIAKIYDGGTTPTGTPFLSMELVDGQPFSESLDAAKMSVKERLELFVQVCRAVQHAHGKGIIHRDLKPSNVLVTRVDGRPAAKVIDFGLAKSIDPEQRIAETELTIHGHVMGTMNYMSPEQAAGDPVDGQTDVYSLGVMLYEALVGSTPIDANSLKGLRPLDALELVREHTASKPSTRLNQNGPKITEIAQRRSTSPTSLRSILTGELDWVVLQAIEKEQSRRYSTVQSLADDVQRYLNHEPVRARPPSLVYKCSKFVRRNRTLVSFTTIVATALLAIGVLVPLLWRSQQESALGRLEKAVLTSPGQFRLTREELEKQRNLIDQISAMDSQRGVAADRQMRNAAIEALAAAIEVPRLQTSNYERLRKVLDSFGHAEFDEAGTARIEALSARIRQLQGEWLTVGDASKANELQALFSPGSVVVEADTVRTLATVISENKSPAERITFSEEFADTTPLTETLLEVSGNARIFASFEGWERDEVGIALKISGRSGYDFVVRPSGSSFANPASLSDLSSESGSEAGRENFAEDKSAIYFAEIRREGTPLFRIELDKQQLADSGSITLVALRDGNTLSLRIGRSDTYQVFDPFPLSPTAPTVVGIRSTPAARLLSLRAESKEATGLSPGVIAGDDAFLAGRFEEALDAYTRQLEQERVSPSLRSEASYKIGLCQLRIDRSDEATKSFERVESQRIAPWNALASIQVWQSANENADFATQVEAYQRLQSLQNVTALAGLIPPATRDQILQENLRPMQIGDLLKSDPNRLDRVSFAAKLDRVLSSDGRGTLAGQFEYSRVLRFEGRLEEAAEVLKELNDRFAHAHVAGIYARVLRLLGKSQEALEFLESTNNAMPNFGNIYADQIPFCHFALGNTQLGDQSLRSAIKEAAGKMVRSKAHMALGFRLWNQGEEEAAKEVWEEGYQLARDHSRSYEDANQASHVYLLVLGSLSDSLQREDSDRFIDLVLNSPSIRSLKPMISMAIPGDRVFAVFSKMWKSSLGMRLAEDMAFERLNLRERTIGPIHIAANQFAADGAFANRLASADSELIFSAMQELLDVWLDGDFILSDLLGMSAAWQGYSSSVSSKLPSETRAKFHYMLGHKRLLKGDRQSAREQLLAARSETEDGTMVSELASETLALMDSSSGTLDIECENEIADGFEIYDESGALVPANPSDSNRKRRLAAGKYTLRNDAIEWSSPVEVKLGKTSPITVRWKWSPRRVSGKLKGLLSHPAELPEHKNWQLVQTSMEASCFDLAWSPDGQSIAIVGDEYLRIADTETFLYTDAIPINGEQLRTVSWSSQGTLATGTGDGRVFMLNAETGERLETAKRFPGKIQQVRWNPAGGLLAVAGQSHQTYIYDSSGQLVDIVDGATGHWMGIVRWSPNGKFLSTTGHKELHVFETSTWKHVAEISELTVGWDVLWTPDSKRFVALDNERFRIFDLKEGQVTKEQPVGEFVGASSMIWGEKESIVLACGRGSNGVIRWDTASNDSLPVSRIPVYGYSPLKVSPDGERVALGNPNGCIIRSRWLERELGCVGKHLKVMLRSSDYCASRRVQAVVDFHKGEATVFDLAANSIRTLDSSSSYRDARWSSDGQFLAACTKGGNVVVFDKSLKIAARVDVSDEPLNNVEWFRQDNSLIVSTESGRLQELTLSRSPGDSPVLSPGAAISPGDELATSWEGSKLIASPDSLAGAFYRNAVLFRLDLRSDEECTMSERLTPSSLHNFNYFGNNRILSNGFCRILSHDSNNDWLAESREILRTPTCFAKEDASTLLFGSEKGCICRYNFDTGEVTKLVDTGREVYDLHLINKDEVLAISLYGVIRKINIRTGEVLQLAVVTRDAPTLLMSGGGKLLSSPESLSEFSCIVEQSGKTALVPATQVLVED